MIQLLGVWSSQYYLQVKYNKIHLVYTNISKCLQSHFELHILISHTLYSFKYFNYNRDNTTYKKLRSVSNNLTNQTSISEEYKYLPLGKTLLLLQLRKKPKRLYPIKSDLALLQWIYILSNYSGHVVAVKLRILNHQAILTYNLVNFINYLCALQLML